MSAHPLLLALCVALVTRGLRAAMDGHLLVVDDATVALVTLAGKLSILPVRDGVTDLYLPAFRPSLLTVARVDVETVASEIARRCEERGRQSVRSECHREGHACENSGLCHRCGVVVNPDWWALAQEAAGVACGETLSQGRLMGGDVNDLLADLDGG